MVAFPVLLLVTEMEISLRDRFHIKDGIHAKPKIPRAHLWPQSPVQFREGAVSTMAHSVPSRREFGAALGPFDEEVRIGHAR